MTLTYSNMPLDRCSNQRKNKRWLKTEFDHPETLFCLINEGKCFFKQSDNITPFYLTKLQLQTLSIDSCIYIGKRELSEVSRGSIFSIDFSKLRFSTQEELEMLGQWQSLRQTTPLLSRSDAAILALAKGLVHWHKTHLYCGHCGNPNRSTEAGHARKCTQCRNMTFPRTDPAVIMLVERMFDDGIARCLLGRQENWPKGVYSTLAGFVDPGETLGEAVIREVLEESGIATINPQYIASQPWPFPASIMLGFTVEATSETIDVSQDTLQEARWFSREQLKTFDMNKASTILQNEKIQPVANANKSEEVQFKMSSADSISSFLINAWKNKQVGKY